MPENLHQTKARSADRKSEQPADFFSTVAFAVPQILKGYKSRFGATKDLIGVEWQLTIRCLALATLIVVCAFSVTLVFWIGLTGLLAWGLYAVGLATWMIVISLILLHMAVLLWLVTSLKRLLSEIGFKRSWNALTQSSDSEPSH